MKSNIFLQNIIDLNGRLHPIFSILLITMIVISLGCGGCGGVKRGVHQSGGSKKNDITNIVNDKAIPNSNLYQDSAELIRTKLPELITFKYYNQESYQFEQYDEYNYARKILVFKDSKTKNVIKEIDIVKENPFHSHGFNRRKEPGKEDFIYFIMKKGTENKFELREYLPIDIFDEIPNEFPFYRAMASISHQNIADKYATVTYGIDWLPDAYSDNGEWFGPGYGVHYVDVYDSLALKIFSHKYSGTSSNASISPDGKYVFNMACISPEWDKNLWYHFTVYKVSDETLAYEEKFENCMKDGGNGGVQTISEENSIGYGIKMNNGTSKDFRYSRGNFMATFKEFTNVDLILLHENEQLKLRFLDGTFKVVSIFDYYKTINLK